MPMYYVKSNLTIPHAIEQGQGILELLSFVLFFHSGIRSAFLEIHGHAHIMVNLVDPASNHLLVSKNKPLMFKCMPRYGF